MNLKKYIFIFIIGVLSFSNLYSQQELTPVSDDVYFFLKRMQVAGVIPDYNSSLLPLSRKQVANYLNQINNSSSVSSSDREVLKGYLLDYSFELKRNPEALSISKNGLSGIFNNDKNKYIYYSYDSTNSLFLNGNLNFSQRIGNGDSLGNRKITLFEPGLKIRGTLRNILGYYLRVSNGAKLNGDSNDVNFAAFTDYKLWSNLKFRIDKTNFDSFEGYLRYSASDDWISVWIGREQINQGFGYNDKMFYSSNTVPFDQINLSIIYDKLNYSFTFGSLKGDSLGRDIPNKIIASHRLNLNLFKTFKIGIFESVISTQTPFSVTYLNPLSFLTSADLNSGDNTTKNNANLGFDFEYNPVKNVAVQGTLLIDDLNLKTITKNDKSYNDNKFAFQFGVFWNNAFGIEKLAMTSEYTRLDPFVYSHRSNKSTYTNWSLPLGHKVSPNSDDISIDLNYTFSKGLSLIAGFNFIRHGAGVIIDSTTNRIVTNYGGDINFGEGDSKNPDKNIFLQGYRINYNNFRVALNCEPVKQLFLNLEAKYLLADYIYISKKLKDFYFRGNLNFVF